MIHLVSYFIMGTVLISIVYAVRLWHRQWIKIRFLRRNLALLHAPDAGLEPLTRRLGLKDKVRVLDSEGHLCFCAGFASPRIYISRMLVEKLTPDELEALLLHEKHHLENHDPLKVMVGKLVVSALFFIPALKDALKCYLMEKEIAADQRAIQYQGRAAGLASALEKLVRERSVCKMGAAAVGEEEALLYRIDHLTGYDLQHMYRFSLRRLVPSILTAAIIVATIVAPLPGSHPA